MSLGRSIARAIPAAIEKEVTSLSDFMEERLFISENFWPTQFVQNTLRQGESFNTKLYTYEEEGLVNTQYV